MHSVNNIFVPITLVFFKLNRMRNWIGLWLPEDGQRTFVEQKML
jgi:hypothetical protein